MYILLYRAGFTSADDEVGHIQRFYQHWRQRGLFGKRTGHVGSNSTKAGKQ